MFIVSIIYPYVSFHIYLNNRSIYIYLNFLVIFICPAFSIFLKCFFFFFNWRIIALPYCISFCRTSAWISHRYTYVAFLQTYASHLLRLSQSTGLSSIYISFLSSFESIAYFFFSFNLSLLIRNCIFCYFNFGHSRISFWILTYQNLTL